VAVTRNSSDDHVNGKSRFVLTPARRRGVELLDDPRVDANDRHRAQDDIRRSNVWLGGLRAALAELRAVIAPRDNTILLDVGTGLADILAEATRDVRKSGGSLTTIGVDGALSLLAAARGSTTGMVCADALALPFRDGSVDVAMCSQLLHHFTDADIERLLRELHRVSRRAVIVCDLRRSWFAAAGFWLVSFPLCFHPITRHDGVVSVLRGFTAGELRRHVNVATGASPRITRRLGFRLTARWTRTETASPS
jgi:SAM-dependent methyltransferase